MLVAETLDFVSINFWHILMAMANLLILTAIVKKFLFKPVMRILKQREEEVSKIYTDADEAKAQAEKDRDFYADKMKHVEQDADKMMKAATARANERSDEIIAKAREEAEHRLEKADADIALKRKKAVDDMRDDISQMVIDLAQQVVEKEITPKDHENLIDDAISKLGDE